jgi:hypothetical protein
VIFTMHPANLPTVERQRRPCLSRSRLLLHSTVVNINCSGHHQGGGIRSACVSKFWGLLHPTQCRHEAVFNCNIGKPWPILDVHAQGMYSVNTLVMSVLYPLPLQLPFQNSKTNPGCIVSEGGTCVQCTINNMFWIQQQLKRTCMLSCKQLKSYDRHITTYIVCGTLSVAGISHWVWSNKQASSCGLNWKRFRRGVVLCKVDLEVSCSKTWPIVLFHKNPKSRNYGTSCVCVLTLREC